MSQDLKICPAELNNLSKKQIFFYKLIDYSWNYILLFLLIFSIYIFNFDYFANIIWKDNSKNNPNLVNNQTDLLVGMSLDYPPFSYKGASGPKGFDVDLAREIGKRLNKNIVFKEFSFEDNLKALSQGLIDFSVSALSSTQIREQNISFSYPYYSTHFALLFKPNKNLNTGKINKKVAVIKDSSLDMFLEKYKTNHNRILNTVYFKNNLAALESLRYGQVDAILIESDFAIKIIRKDRYNLAVQYIPKEGPESYSVATKKNSPLIQDINPLIIAMLNDGTIEKLQRKWLY